jgi:hypothetical protein
MQNAVSMLKLQADLIGGELRILELAAVVCETNNLPETARGIRLCITILRESAILINQTANELEETCASK